MTAGNVARLETVSPSVVLSAFPASRRAMTQERIAEFVIARSEATKQSIRPQKEEWIASSLRSSQ